ncbi:MAG: hypothetical protein ACP5ON_10560 [Bacteroidota bacterium]
MFIRMRLSKIFARLRTIHYLVVLLVALNVVFAERSIFFLKRVQNLVREKKIIEYETSTIRLEQNLMNQRLLDVTLFDHFGVERKLSSCLNGKKVYILFFFSFEDCLNCLREETDELNKIASRPDALVIGVAVGGPSNDLAPWLLETVKPAFPIFFMQGTKFLANVESQPTPAALLIDTDLRIVFAYLSEPNNSSKRENFYNLLRYMLP